MSILDRQLENNSLSNAYIFESPNADYNLEYTNNFVKKVFEQKGIDIDNNTNPDFYIIDKGFDTIDIESIRQILKDISLKPSNNKIKIYLIHNAHNMRQEGSNAMLKTIEDLKEYNLVIFTTTNSQLILPTIRSRCQIISLDSDPSSLNIDMDKLSEILSKVFRGDIAGFYKEKSFFNEFKEDKDTLFDAIIYIVDNIIKLKYDQDLNLSEEIIYNINPMTSMKVADLEDISNLLYKIKKGLKNNINYDLAIEQIIFTIYRKGMKL